VSGSGQARPRASTIVTLAIVTALAAILSTGEPERLYTGLSVLVSTAVDGEEVAALASFSSLELLLNPPAGDDVFTRSLRELIAAARELDSLTIHACAASVQTMGLPGQPLDGVKSTPRFLRDTAGARLIFV
jgi:peroxiredoxin family protein